MTALAAPEGHNLYKQPRPYICSICQRSFKRNEHRLRHERGHTKVKPFPCGFCGRRYARKDLVTRHEQSFHPNGNGERLQNVIGWQARSSSEESPQDSHPATRELRSNWGLSTPSTAEIDVQQLTKEIPSSQQPVGNGDAFSTSTDTVNEPMNRSQTTQNHVVFSALSAETTQHVTIDLQIPNDHSPSSSNQSRSLELDHMCSNGQQFLDNTSSVSSLASNQDAPHHRGLSSAGVDEPNQTQCGNDWQGRFPLQRDENGLVTHEIDLPNDTLVQPRYMDDQPQDMDFFALLSSGTSHPNMNFSSTQSITANVSISDNSWEDFSWETLGLMAFQPPHLTHSPSSTEHRVGPQSNADAQVANKLYQGKLGESVTPLIDNTIYAALQQELRQAMSLEMQFTLPNASKLEQFMTSYFSCFHKHFPILHLPSISSEQPYFPLFLAMMAIGALYRLNRTSAKEIWVCAQAMLEPDCKRKDFQTQIPVQVIQAKLLLTIFAVFEGHVPDVIASMESVGFWTTEYRLRRGHLATQNTGLNGLTWAEWCARETTKRILCGMFILSSLLTVTYDTTPFISVTPQDLNMEIPEPEQKWQAANAQKWEEVCLAQGKFCLPTIRDVTAYLIFNNGSPLYHDVAQHKDVWSGFATTVVMHAVNIHMWQIMQGTQSFTSFPTETAFVQMMIAQVEQSLGRCYALLTSHQLERDLTAESGDGPQIFNCLALLRSLYVRVFTGVVNFDRIMLLNEDKDQIRCSIQSYVRVPQIRSSLLTKAISKAYGGLAMPITAGYLLVRKTAALTWSLEHAVAAWDCALFVTKWIHGVETRQCIPSGPLELAESENLTKFRTTLSEAESDYEGTGSLAAEVAYVWASFLDDTWVWGITPRMGHLLRLLSREYEEEWSRISHNTE